MPLLQRIYLDKHNTVARSAIDLTRMGIAVKAAALLRRGLTNAGCGVIVGR